MPHKVHWCKRISLLSVSQQPISLSFSGVPYIDQGCQVKWKPSQIKWYPQKTEAADEKLYNRWWNESWVVEGLDEFQWAQGEA